MFPQIIQALSVSPQAISHLTFYARRLAKENITRKLSAGAAMLLVGLQLATIVAPATNVNASSSNDIIQGGFGTQQRLLQFYDQGVAGIQYESAAQLQAIYSYFGISRQDIVNAHMGTVNSKDHTIASVGHNPHQATDQVLSAGGMTLYWRSLSSWDTGSNVTNGSTYQALIGTRSADGAWFGILVQCGNVVARSIPAAKPVATPVATPLPTPVATPVKTPSATPVPTPKPTPVVIPPNITEHKSAFNVTQNVDATSVKANPGDVIKYTLTTGNSGGSTNKATKIFDAIPDILEYAANNLVANTGGATLNGDTLTWPSVDIAAGAEVTNTFTIDVTTDPTVLNTPVSSSDPQSFDLNMDNVYGNTIRVSITAPPAKQVELANTNLPQTGAGTTTLIVLIVSGLIFYFYYRNKQLMTEIKILRNDYQGGGY